MPRKKLRDLLMMIIRTFIVLFVVLFFSRPVLQKGGVFGVRSQDSAMVLLVDVSASMGVVVGGRPALALAKEQLPAVLRKIPSGVRIGLVAYSDRVEKELAPTAERSQVTSALETLEVMPRPTDIFPALEMASGMLARQPAGRKSILIASDQARNGWEKALQNPGRWEKFDPETAVIAWEVVGKVRNQGIAEATLTLNQEGTLNGSWMLNNSEAKAGASTWRLDLNGRVVSQGSLAEARGRWAEMPFQAQLPEGGFYAGQISLTADALPLDDVFYLAGRLPKGFRLLVVDGEGGLAPSDSETYYLKLALESPRDPRLESIKVIRPELLVSESLGTYDVIVLANVAAAGGREEELRRWIEAGGGLLLTAGSKWPKDPETPLKYFRSKPRRAGKTAVQTPDPKALFLSGVAGLESFQWDQVAVNQYVPLEEESAAVPIIRLANGDALLLRKQVGNGFVLCLTSSIDRAWTNLPAKPIFAPLMREVISSLADPMREQASLNGFIDEDIRLRLPAGVRNVTVAAPDGRSVGAHVDRDGTLVWPAPTGPGLYRVKTDRKEFDFSFAVNMRGLRGEGDVSRLGASELKDVFPGAPVEWVSHEGKGTETVLGALQGKDLTTLLLVLVFVLMTLELILSLRAPEGGEAISGPWRLLRRGTALLAMTALGLSAVPVGAAGGAGNSFVYAQLKHEGAWDPYPNVHEQVMRMMGSMTNIPFSPERKVVTLSDPTLFETPFLLIKGNSGLELGRAEKLQLKQFIDRGGFVFIDDSLADAKGPFAASIRLLMMELYPDRSFQKLPMDHAIFRSFFLLRNVAGRRISERALEGLDVGGGGGGEGRTAVLYCPNDLLGAWMRDNLNAYVYTCEPGGEAQRWESFKLTLNIIYFGLTGTYKRDAIHQPFIERKLGS